MSDDGARRVLRVITGPTAAGKSALALTLAEARGLAIVSADSRQVYTGFDIGTAKPSREERDRVPHYGIDVVSPLMRYSAHAWAEDASRWMAQAIALGRDSVVVGGTGFYVRALVSPLASVPELDTVRRARLEGWLAAQDRATISRLCTRLDPERATLGRTQQLRAIETALLAGTRLSDAHRAGASASPRAVRYLVVDPGSVLAQRIAARVEAMIARGWIEEVERLHAALPASAPAWKASGYEVLRTHVEGGLARDDAIGRVIVETRQYAKRQRTWCRHQLTGGAVTWLDPDSPDALDRALAWWDGKEEETA